MKRKRGISKWKNSNRQILTAHHDSSSKVSPIKPIWRTDLAAVSPSLISVRIKHLSAHLAPDQHGAEDHLQAVEEVVPDEDDGGAAGRPALAGTDGFDAGRGCFGNMSHNVRDTAT